ncbi:hypothetical protein OE165_28260, partial [Escherichia coli]|uniref:hypothetical protein n=1 Tax=Escherichia coli TaxID=562 RepID=UPI0021F323A1
SAAVETNATPVTTTSNPTNQFAIDTLYTNLPQRTLLVGSAVLNSGVAGDANITLHYTNSGNWYRLPIQIGLGIAMADKIP